LASDAEFFLISFTKDISQFSKKVLYDIRNESNVFMCYFRLSINKFRSSDKTNLLK